MPTDAELIVVLRSRLMRYLVVVPSLSLANAIAANWCMLSGRIAARLCGDHPPQVLFYASWSRAVQLERACYAAAYGRIAAAKGVVLSNDPDFRREYSCLLYRVAGALDERIPLPDQVDAPPEVLAPQAAGLYAQAARDRHNARIAFRDSATERCTRAGCGSKKISVQSVQTRSTDEAPTIMNRCNDCGHCWRS